MSEREIVEGFRDQTARAHGLSLAYWHETGHPNWLALAQRNERVSSALTSSLDGKQLDSAGEKDLNDNLELFTLEIVRMSRLPTNALGSVKGEKLRDVQAEHRRFVAAVRALQRQAR